MTTTSWFRSASALFAVGWGANQFSSLIVAYREHSGVSVAVSQALFAAYAVGLIPTLLLGGPASDRFGRRALARVALVTSLVATVLLMIGDETVVLLYLGRFLAGVASGAVFAPGTAWVKELSVPPHDLQAGEQSGARRAAIALSSGFGIGPLVAGLVAQWSPAPLVVCYLPHVVVLAVAAPMVWTAPETVTARTWTGVRAGAALRPRFRSVVAPAAPFVFLAPAVGMAVLPGLVAAHTHGLQIAFAAVTAGVTLGVGVLVQPLARRLDAHRGGGSARGLLTGLAAVTGGCLLAAWCAATANPLLALVATMLLGAGYGFVLVSGLIEVQRIASPAELAGLTAVFYALTYLGFFVPLVLAWLDDLASYTVLLLVTAAIAALTCGWVRVRSAVSVPDARLPA